MKLPKIRVRMDILEMIALQYEARVGNWHISTVREMIRGNFDAFKRKLRLLNEPAQISFTWTSWMDSSYPTSQ